MEEIKFIETNKIDRAWLTKFRNFMIVLMVGFALGTMVSNATFTYQLQKDCETMRQFRIGNLAYTCMVK
jgi:uncharacterized membrane protein